MYPRLYHATAEQLADWQISDGGYGIHWPEIDVTFQTPVILLAELAVIRKSLHSGVLPN
jgi:hypothetical protein